MGYKVQILRFSCLMARVDIINKILHRSSFSSAITRFFHHGHGIHLQFSAVFLLRVGHVYQVGLSRILNDLLKAFLDAHVILCRGLHVDGVVSCCKVEDLVCGYIDVEIAFATDKVNSALHLKVFDFVQPMRQVIKGGSIAKVEAKKDGIGIYMRNEVLL